MPNFSKITHAGETLCLLEWSRRTGIPTSTIKARVVKLGWSWERALTTPTDKRFARGGRRKKSGPRPCPEMREHPTTGTAYCRWNLHGKQWWRYFGKYGTPQAEADYRRFAMEWAAGSAEQELPPGFNATIGDMVIRWIDHCERTYRKNGKPTSEYHLNRTAMTELVALYGDQLASRFDGKRFRAVREAMVLCGWTRKTINDHAARILRALAWAATEGIVPPVVHQTLSLVEPLARGRRSDIREGKGCRPVPHEHIEAVLANEDHDIAPRRAVLNAMILTQLHTGMRPGELCSLTVEQIDRKTEPWRYEVTAYNKLLHKSIQRAVFFGPRARAALAPLIEKTPAGEQVFRLPPWRRDAIYTPVTVAIYRKAIKDACEFAQVPTWRPNQLRHNKATDLMNLYEHDAAAAAVLGNSPEVARQVYADRPGESVAKRIAEATG